MGSICSTEGFKDKCSGGGKGKEDEEEEKRLLCFAYEPNQDFLFASHGTKDDNKHRIWIPISSSVQEKEEERGITILIRAVFFRILVREFVLKVIEWKLEENENGKDTISSSSSYPLSDELQLLVMSKVPFHSLVKFRHISKTWRSWIYKEHFFLGKCPLITDGIFFTGRNGFTYIPLPNHHHHHHYHHHHHHDEEDRSTIRTLPFPTINDGSSSLCFKTFRHAFNALLLLSTVRDGTIELLAHNPLTGQSLLLPRSSHSFGPLWIGYEPRHSPYFSVVRLVLTSGGGTSLVLQIFSSSKWTWRDLVVDDLRPIISPGSGTGRGVTKDGSMFIDLTFSCSTILVVDLHIRMDCFTVPLPPGLPARLEDAWSALGMCLGDIMYAYSQTGVLLVYKLLRLQQSEYRWTLLVEDGSLQDRLGSKAYRVEARDFLLHKPVLLISSICSVTRSRMVFTYNFMDGSVLQVFESGSRIHSITPLSICPLEIYSGDSS